MPKELRKHLKMVPSSAHFSRRSKRNLNSRISSSSLKLSGRHALRRLLRGVRVCVTSSICTTVLDNRNVTDSYLSRLRLKGSLIVGQIRYSNLSCLGTIHITKRIEHGRHIWKEDFLGLLVDSSQTYNISIYGARVNPPFCL